MDGRISIKFHQPSYFFSHYELRERAIFFYDDNWRSCDKDNFSVVFTEVTFNYLDNPEDYLALKYADKVVKIKKDHDSRILIQTIEQKLLFCTFKGAYMLRNEVPNLFVLDFL